MTEHEPKRQLHNPGDQTQLLPLYHSSLQAESLTVGGGMVTGLGHRHRVPTISFLPVTSWQPTPKRLQNTEVGNEALGILEERKAEGRPTTRWSSSQAH